MSMQPGPLDRTFLCEVIGGSAAYVELRPLAVAAPDGDAWLETLDRQRCLQLFPNTGSVLWFRALPLPKLRTTWEVRIAESPTFRPDGAGSSRFRTVECVPAVELLDFRSKGGPEVARELLGDGIRLSRPPSASAYAWCPPEAIGPLVLREASRGVWQLPAESAQMPLKVWQEPEARAILQIPGEVGASVFATGRARPSKLLGQVDWSDDKTLLVRVLQDLRRLDKAYTDSLGLTLLALKHYADAMPVGPTRADNHLIVQRLTRAEGLLARLKDRAPLEEEVAKGLMDLPAARLLLTSELERQQQLARSAMRVEQAEHEERLRANVLQRDDMARQIADLERRIDERAAQLASDLEMLDADMRHRLQELAEQPLKALTDAFIARAAGHPFAAAITPTRPAALPKTPPDKRVAPENIAETDLAGFLGELDRRLAALGFTRQLSRVLLAGFLSGGAPLLIGASARRVLSAFADCLTAEGPTLIDASAAAFRVDDLLVEFDDSGAPRPNSFLGLLTAASHQRMHVVVLDGINRGPIESYLTPAVESYRDGQRGLSRRLTVERGAVDVDCWPEEVLLSLTVTDGPTVLPVPAHFWAHCIVIALEEFVGEGGPRPLAADEVRLAVSPRTFAGWRKQASLIDANDYREVARSVAGKVDPGSLEVGVRFFGALALVEVKQEPALAQAIAGCLCPLLAARGTEYPDEGTFDDDRVKRSWAHVRVLSH